MRHAFSLALVLLSVGCAARPLERVDPPAELLQTTRANELGGRWSNLTEFCVEKDGSLAKIRTVYSSGDPWLDEIYRDALAKWRYEPTTSRSPRCRKIRFDEDFGPQRRPPEPAIPTPAATLGAPKPRPSVIPFRAIHKPSPPSDRLRTLAEAAGISNWTLINRTSFCVRPDGTVGEVSTLRSTGVIEIDRLARAAISSWKFEPSTRGGGVACFNTDVEFTIHIN